MGHRIRLGNYILYMPRSTLSSPDSRQHILNMFTFEKKKRMKKEIKPPKERRSRMDSRFYLVRSVSLLSFVWASSSQKSSGGCYMLQRSHHFYVGCPKRKEGINKACVRKMRHSEWIISVTSPPRQGWKSWWETFGRTLAVRIYFC